MLDKYVKAEEKYPMTNNQEDEKKYPMVDN